MTIFYSFHFNALVYSDLHISLPLAILTVGHLSPLAPVPVADTSRDLSMPAAGTSGAARSFGLLVIPARAPKQRDGFALPLR